VGSRDCMAGTMERPERRMGTRDIEVGRGKVVVVV
jgi:hypothetical protein